MTTREPKRRRRHTRSEEKLFDLDLEMHNEAMKLDRKHKSYYIT